MNIVLFIVLFISNSYRVNDYLNNALASHLVDPDNGINIARKKLKLGMVSDVHPNKENFPSSGFDADLSILPKFQHNFLWKFMIEDIEQQKQLSTEKPLVKGYNLFKSGHVLEMFAQQRNHTYYFFSKVLPSMKKGKVYSVQIAFNKDGSVNQASCGCPAGVDGRCNHVTASLFALESFSTSSECNNNLSEDPTTPCTSKPCKWNVPRQKKVDPSPIRSMTFVKHEYGKEKSPKAVKTVRDVRAPHQQNVTQEQLSNVLEMVKGVEAKTGKKLGLSFILPQTLPNNSEPTENVSHQQTSSWNLNSPDHPKQNGPLSLDEIRAKAKRFAKRLFSSGKCQADIEYETRGQHKTSAWYTVRQHRITASKAKRCLLRDSTSPTKAIAAVLQYGGNIQTKAMKEGIEWEGKIIERYEYVSANKVEKSGFVVSCQHPFLGASPDGRSHP